MKRYFFYIILLISAEASGQLTELPDTIKINEVVIRSPLQQERSAGFRTLQIDTLLVKMNAGENLGELLSGTSALYIKSYGPGGISTPSFRGTSASHTQISWNGMSISNPMLGQTDLAVIPSGIADKVNIYFGPNPGKGLNPGIGGTISLEDKPDWMRGSEVSLTANAGSFGRYSSIVKALTGNETFQSSTRLYYNSFENDFTFLNKYSGKDPVPEHRTNSSATIKGAMQEVYLKHKTLTVSGRVWYQSALRDLPQPVIAITGYDEYQTDESLRAMIEVMSVKNNNEFFITAGNTYNKLNYVNKLIETDSRNVTNNFILRAGTTLKILPSATIRMILENDLGVVNSNNYDGIKKRDISSVSLNINGSAGKIISYSFLLREKAEDLKFLVPDFSVGTSMKLFPNRNHFVDATFSRNSRLPSMNELFWNPGGNPYLRNEKAFIYEVGYRLSENLGESVVLSSQTVLYHNNIADMIQWRPGPSSYWVPENLGNIHSSGIEANLNFTWSLNSSEIETNFAWALTQSRQVNPVNEDYIGKQLIYVPENSISSHLKYTTGKFYSVILYTYTGTRYTEPDNSAGLPGFSLLNCISGYKFKIPYGNLNLCAKVENLLGTYYETVAFYPQPGRSFTFTMTYEYSNRQKAK